MTTTLLNGQRADGPAEGRNVPLVVAAKSWKVEVIGGEGERWSTNACRFPSRDAAVSWGSGLYCRWTGCYAWRVTPCLDAVTE